MVEVNPFGVAPVVREAHALARRAEAGRSRVRAAGIHADELLPGVVRIVRGDVLDPVAAHLQLVVSEIGGEASVVVLALSLVVAEVSADSAEAHKGWVEGVVGGDGAVEDRDPAPIERFEAELVVVPRGLQRQHAEGPEELVEPPRVVLRADVVTAREGVRVGSGRCEDGAVADFRIPEVRPDERRALDDVPGQLPGEEVEEVLLVEVLVVDGRRRLGNAVAVVVDAVVRREEPEVVLDEEAAHVRAVVELLHVLEGRVELVSTRRVERLGAERGRAQVAEHVAVELVAPRLRDDVDDPAGRASELGLVAAGLDLDLLDELVVDDLALDSAVDLVRVDSVDHEHVLRGGRAVDREREPPALRVAGVLVDARLKLHDARVVSTERQLLHDLRRVVGAARRVRDVDDRRLPADHDLFLLRDLKSVVDGGRRTERDGRRLLRRREPGQGADDPVVAGRHGRDAVRAAVAGDRRARPLQLRARRRAGHAGQSGARRIGHGACDVARGLGERQASRRRADDRDRQQRQEVPPKSPHRTPSSVIPTRMGGSRRVESRDEDTNS